MIGAFLVDLAVCLMAADIQFDDHEQDCHHDHFSNQLEAKKAVPSICINSKSCSGAVNDSNNNDHAKAQHQESPLWLNNIIIIPFHYEW